MIPNQPIYVMGRNSKRKFTPCGKCSHAVKPGRKYTIDPVDPSIIYHADCYRQKYRKWEKS